MSKPERRPDTVRLTDDSLSAFRAKLEIERAYFLAGLLDLRKPTFSKLLNSGAVLASPRTIQGLTRLGELFGVPPDRVFEVSQLARKASRKAKLKPGSHRVATVWIEPDGSLAVEVHLGWHDHPDWRAKLSQELAEAAMRVVGGEHAVREFRSLNAPTKRVH